jgi:hypothetical protein
MFHIPVFNKSWFRHTGYITQTNSFELRSFQKFEAPVVLNTAREFKIPSVYKDIGWRLLWIFLFLFLLARNTQLICTVSYRSGRMTKFRKEFLDRLLFYAASFPNTRICLRPARRLFLKCIGLSTARFIPRDTRHSQKHLVDYKK